MPDDLGKIEGHENGRTRQRAAQPGREGHDRRLPGNRCAAVAPRWSADAGPCLRLELDAQRRNGGIHSGAGGSRKGGPELPATARRRLAADGIPRAAGLDPLHARRAAGVVPVSGARMRAPGGVALQRGRNLRLPTLLPPGLRLPAGIRRRPGGTAGRQNPGAAWVGAGNPERARRQGEGNALAYLRPA